MRILWLLSLIFVSIFFVGCQTTGDPRQGGLFGWSEKKAIERQQLIALLAEPVRVYINIKPEIILYKIQTYMLSKKFKIKDKKYSKGYISGAKESIVAKRFLWYKWKEKNEIICRVQVDLTDKNRILLFVYKETEKKEPLSEKYSKSALSERFVDEIDEMLLFLDNEITKNGGKVG